MTSGVVPRVESLDHSTTNAAAAASTSNGNHPAQKQQAPTHDKHHPDKSTTGNKLSTAALKQHSEKESLRHSMPQIFPPQRERKRKHAEPTSENWFTWVCPICQEDIQVKGWCHGEYYRKRRLQVVHNAQLKDYPLPGRSNNTHRCFLRAKQSQQDSNGNKHSLVHVLSAGLTDCVPKNTTWICKQCLAKGNTSSLHNSICDPLSQNAGRAKWWTALSDKAKETLTEKLQLSDDFLTQQNDHFENLISKSRPHKKRYESDKAYNNKLKELRTDARKRHNQCADPTKVSGATNSSALFIPRMQRKVGSTGSFVQIRQVDPKTKDPDTPHTSNSSSGSYNSDREQTEKPHPPLNSWKRDLTEEGIEPNPGPRIWQINIRGLHLRRDILLHALTQNVQAIVMQETRLTQLEAAGINRHNKHWHFFHTDTPRQQPGQAAQGGVAIAIRKNIPAGLAHKHADNDGEWLDVATPNFHLISVYRRPSANKEVLSEQLSEYLASLGSAKWLMGGDLNNPPLNDPLLIYGASLHAQIFYPQGNHHQPDSDQNLFPVPSPTRWDGNRCIDWGLQHNLASQPIIRHEKYSDHRLLEYAIPEAWESQKGRRFCPQPKFDPPQHLTEKDWINLVESKWIITVMPQQQHGCLKKKGTHTALIPPLAAVETSLAQPHNNNTISYVGATDLSKAFDKMAWKHSIAALTRMGLPRRILTPLANAWENQQRWLTTANHIGTQPVSAQCLPQGDPASPLALMAPLSEALQRILHAHPDAQFGRQIHSLYMDDRCWFCTRASTCISIAPPTWRK